MDVSVFRAQLEQVLRQKNPAALRQFLVEQGQWPQDTTIDAERAMWTMILGNTALAALHPAAHAWLVAHGHPADAALLLGERADSPGEKKSRSLSDKGQNGKRPSRKKY